VPAPLGDCDEVMCRMRWTRRRVNRMRLTEWRELITQVRWCISKRAVDDLYQEDTDVVELGW